MEPLQFGGELYTVEPAEAGATVELQATADGLYLKLRFAAAVVGPCYRCLEPARVRVKVNASEYQARGAGTIDDEMSCEYLEDDQLDVDRWARDALVLALPGQDPVPLRLRGPVPAVRRAARPGLRPRLRPRRTRPALGRAPQAARVATATTGDWPRLWPVQSCDGSDTGQRCRARHRAGVAWLYCPADGRPQAKDLEVAP